ncbi:MAG: metabolite traffic protein EboE, partial [Phycisphaerae bacterium]
MILSSSPPLHLTYCLNIHPGETWAENFAAVREKAMRVRRAVAPARSFGLGLRLSNEAAVELSDPGTLADFREFLAANDLYVFTINGFPHGRFHGTGVKEDVYRPDWRTPERRDYTIRLTDILAALLPEGVTGSISTVPGSYRSWIRTPDDVKQMCRMLAEAALHAAATLDETGRDICIALEPEPDCFIESTDEAVAFFAETLPAAAGGLADRLGVPPDHVARALSRHLGVCFDTAHAAVQFEEPAESLGRIASAGVRVGKVQLSAALRLRPTS